MLFSKAQPRIVCYWCSYLDHEAAPIECRFGSILRVEVKLFATCVELFYEASAEACSGKLASLPRCRRGCERVVSFGTTVDSFLPEQRKGRRKG